MCLKRHTLLLIIIGPKLTAAEGVVLETETKGLTGLVKPLRYIRGWFFFYYFYNVVNLIRNVRNNANIYGAGKGYWPQDCCDDFERKFLFGKEIDSQNNG